MNSLYYYGRHQDFARQKPRHDAHELNHLRLWYSPLWFKGKPGSTSMKEIENLEWESPTAFRFDTMDAEKRYYTKTYDDILAVNSEAAVQSCEAGGIQIWQWQVRRTNAAEQTEGTMHAKYAVFDRRVSIVGFGYDNLETVFCGFVPTRSASHHVNADHVPALRKDAPSWKSES